MEDLTIDDEAIKSASVEYKEVKKKGNPNWGKKGDLSKENKKPEESVEPEKELISCLKNERVIVRYIIKPTANITNPKHLLYGGMAEGASRTFVVPRRKGGLFVNVLTNQEKDFLENIMGLEPDAMSIYKKQDNFWDDSNPNGVNIVKLEKQDNYLNLESPTDYIKYKILLANKDFICKSLQELKDRPKSTYQFVIITEEGQVEMDNLNMTTTMRCYKEFGKIETNIDVLSLIIEQMTGKPFVSGRSKLIYLQTKVNELIQGNPKMFLNIVTDPYLLTYVLIKKAIEHGVIVKRNDLLYYKKDNTPLCEIGEESTKSISAKYLNSPKHQELRFAIEAEIKAIEK